MNINNDIIQISIYTKNFNSNGIYIAIICIETNLEAKPQYSKIIFRREYNNMFNNFESNLNYELLANMCFIVHIFVIFFMVGGILISKKNYPKVHIFHRAFGSSVFVGQLLLGFYCPLTALENYLRFRNNPEKILYEPFITRILREEFGVSVPTLIITILTVIIGIICVTSLRTYIVQKNSQCVEEVNN